MREVRDNQRVDVSYETLRAFAIANSEHLKENAEGLSLIDYLRENKPEFADLDIIPSLSRITFDSAHKIDLTGADLTGCDLSGVNFSGKHVILKEANLAGCKLEGATFTDSIDLAGTNLGSIVLDSKIFKKCQLVNAVYDPTAAKVALVEVTDKQINGYLKERAKGNPIASGSLNDFLTKSLGSRYPEGTIVIANLEGRTIDERFSGADLSCSNLEGSTITGNITDLNLRDCLMNQVHFENCKLERPDLRGSSLAAGARVDENYIAALFLGEVVFDSPKLSIGNYISKALEKGVIPEATDLEEEDGRTTPGSFNIEGEAIFDPCYVKGSNAEAFNYIDCTLEDIQEYKEHCAELKSGGKRVDELPSLGEYIAQLHPEYPKPFIPDLTGAILRDLDLSGLNFKGTSFAFCDLKGVKFTGSILDNCNFAGTDFSISSLNFWGTPASLEGASIKSSDLTCVNLSGINAKGADLSGSVAINLIAEGTKFTNAVADGMDLSGAWLRDISAQELRAVGTNLSYCFSRGGDYKKANLERSKLDYGDFSSCNFTEANLNYASLVSTRLKNANLTKTQLKHSRLQADVSGANLTETVLEDADLAGMFFEKDDPPKIQNVDFSKAIDSEEVHTLSKEQCKQQMERNAKSVYRTYKIGIFIGFVALVLLSAAAIYAALPAVLATGIIIASAPYAITAVAAVGGILAGEGKVKQYTGIDLGISKACANALGAKKVIQAMKSGLQSQVIEEDKKIAVINEERSNLIKIEKEIREEQARGGDVSHQKVNDFNERATKLYGDKVQRKQVDVAKSI